MPARLLLMLINRKSQKRKIQEKINLKLNKVFFNGLIFCDYTSSGRDSILT